MDKHKLYEQYIFDSLVAYNVPELFYLALRKGNILKIQDAEYKTVGDWFKYSRHYIISKIDCDALVEKREDKYAKQVAQQLNNIIQGDTNG